MKFFKRKYTCSYYHNIGSFYYKFVQNFVIYQMNFGIVDFDF